MISVENLKVEFNAIPLVEDVSFVVNNKERIALVGKNGAGKSTMLKIIAGQQTPTGGSVASPKEVTIGYLPQVMVLAEDKTVRQEAEMAFEQMSYLQDLLAKMTIEMTERTDYESESYHDLIDRFTRENDRFLMLGGTNYHAEVERTLLGLGFSREDFGRPTKEFSGGWRMRIELAKLLLQKPDVLLLDEPTNHLDIESIQWLENFLRTQANAVILVSQLRAYENQQKQIQETEDFIERFRYQATKAIQVQSRIKQLEKVNRIEIDDEDTAMLRLKFPPAPRSGSYPVISKDVKKAYGNHLVFDHVDLVIERGDKVAFVGKNGEGKSTLVKCILEQIDFEGELKLGHNVQIGYFAQNQAQLLADDLTVFDTIDRVAVGDIRTKIRDLLGAFMFGGEASDKKVKVLSGGERSRLAMIKLLLEPVNFLILDEPTNHLDMRSKDVLKEAILDFDGTVVVVSHDRDFLDGLVTKVYEFGGGKVREHLGGIYDFLQKKNIDNLNDLQAVRLSASPTKSADGETTQELSETKLSYEAQKELNRRLRKIERDIKECEKKIEKLEVKKAEIETVLATPQGASDVSVYEKYEKNKQDINEIMAQWETLLMAHEELEAQKY